MANDAEQLFLINLSLIFVMIFVHERSDFME